MVFLPVGAFVLPDVLAQEQKRIIALTNQARQEKNLPPLSISDKLDTSAQYKADDMAEKNYFAHYNNQKGLSNWLREANYSYQVAGENLAVGFSSAEDIVAAWKNSPSHYANLIDADFKELGVGLSGGVYNGRATIFIAQHLALPLSVINEKVVAKKNNSKKSSTVILKNADVTTLVTSTETLAQASSSSVLSGKIKNNDQDQVPVVDLDMQTPIEKYIHAKTVLHPLTNIFSVSQNIYFAAMIFFIVALALSVVTHVRKQRFHIIAQTGGLIALLFIFWKF